MLELNYLIDNLQKIVDEYNIHIINGIFLVFSVIMIVFGGLLSRMESVLPTFIRQSLRYGKHSYKGVGGSGGGNPWLTRMEVPKAWFAHFYVFAFAWSVMGLYLILKCVLLQQSAPELVLRFLDLVGGGSDSLKRPVKISSRQALIGGVLMLMQCARRFYESNFVQIFSKKSRINGAHYLVGYLHYFGAILALLINTEGFTRDSSPTRFSFTQISMLEFVCIFVFHFSWTQQWKTNMILVNLRKDAKTGNIKTEQHLLPIDGFFRWISSPHMSFEILMYVSLLGVLWQSETWRYITLWVISNQVLTALLTHEWYKQTFPHYPANRKALIPMLL